MTSKEFSEIAGQAAQLAHRLEVSARQAGPLTNRHTLLAYHFLTAARLAREAAEHLVQEEEKSNAAG